ncbi:MAG: type II toxin-antitoxin system HicB family antitoxin [Chloroflexota bacterium]|nr:type II toxin-antitoxin system HicB family antitoxin [Chloroflexota bacterium]
MNKYSFSVMWSDEDEEFVALCTEFPGLSGLGETPEEAIAELQVALKLAIETYEAEGWALPEPQVLHEYSGKLLVRMPKMLHGKLARQAEIEGVSLNTLVVTMLSEAVGLAAVRFKVEQVVGNAFRDWRADFAQAIAALFQFQRRTSDTRFVQRTERPQQYIEAVVPAASQVRYLQLQQSITQSARLPHSQVVLGRSKS